MCIRDSAERLQSGLAHAEDSSRRRSWASAGARMTPDALPLLHPLPDRIVTSRLVLRPWSVADAPVLKALIDANLEHLRAWMPWALNEPSPVEAVAQRIETVSYTHLRAHETPEHL